MARWQSLCEALPGPGPFLRFISPLDGAGGSGPCVFSEKNPWVVPGGPGARVRPELVQNCERAGRERWFDWGPIGDWVESRPLLPRGASGFRGRRDFAGPRGPCDLPLHWPPGAIGLGGTRIAEGRERGGPGSGSGADPELKGLALRSVVAGSAGHCGVDCPWSCVLAW
ncbi:hypothetical protein NDU88_003788 [Pleurodeles waltl]|uniref:Uncharacterized protein n=1 Tax=Pleurodeles waltl TaxID=8319 RepID=A0AAV7LJH3_PLEWA|nr:hypothetical protein NDU88_003788 [Pleurodeles waltl]